MDLPGLEDLKASGLLDKRPAIDAIPSSGSLFGDELDDATDDSDDSEFDDDDDQDNSELEDETEIEEEAAA
jgi:segregation and condensation protein B